MVELECFGICEQKNENIEHQKKGQRSYEKGQCGKGHIDGKRSTWGRSFYGGKVNIGRSWLERRVIIGREKVTL